MFFASNLQFLRKRSNLTQEKLAQQLGVSRQAISKWESGETTPELPTLLQLADLFSCTLDELLRQELSPSVCPVRIVKVRGFRMARCCVISANGQKDLQTLLHTWASGQNLQDPILLLWSFPYVTEEQKKRFHLEGFEGGCLLPADFTPTDTAYPILSQADCTYALLSIEETEGRSASQIGRAVHTILETLHTQGIRKTAREGFLPCFERRYQKDGVTIAEIYLQCQDSETDEAITLY